MSAARDAVDGLGFQRQAGADPFPEERPLRVGSYDYDGTSYKLHVHIVAENDPEARELIYFRDRVASDPALIDEYVESKRQSLAAIRGGTVDIAHNIAYNDGKGPFIRRILAEMEQDPATGEPQAR
ncbi:MAG: GrpB family protein [Thermomicrobiales bacterium]